MQAFVLRVKIEILQAFSNRVSNFVFYVLYFMVVYSSFQPCSSRRSSNDIRQSITHEYQTFDFLKIAEYKYYITQLPTHIDLLGYGNFSRRQFRQMAAKNMKFVGAFSLPLFSTPSKLRIKHLFGWSLHNIGENPKGMCVASSFFDIEPTFL